MRRHQRSSALLFMITPLSSNSAFLFHELPDLSTSDPFYWNPGLRGLAGSHSGDRSSRAYRLSNVLEHLELQSAGSRQARIHGDQDFVGDGPVLASSKASITICVSSMTMSVNVP